MWHMKRSSKDSLCQIALIVSMVLASQECPSQAPAQQPKARAVASSSEVQGFTVKLTFSDKARQALTSRSETIVVVGYLTGFPRKGTPKHYKDEEGEVGLGQIKSEIALGASATFEPVKLDSAALKWVDAQGPQLLINVYSGRKSSQNNLLDCGIYEGSLLSVEGQNVPVSCKLIGE
jgi:hypothetical protein